MNFSVSQTELEGIGKELLLIERGRSKVLNRTDLLNGENCLNVALIVSKLGTHFR